MNQDDINRAEWANPENWGGPRMIALYFSKKDTRTWVPKRIPWMGWTINLAHGAGVAWLFGILIGLPLFVILVFALTLPGR